MKKQFILGVLVGGTLTLLLCPDPPSRLRSFAARLRTLPSVGTASDRATGAFAKVLSAISLRLEVARQEARLAADEVRRQLWSEFEAARRRQQRPHP